MQQLAGGVAACTKPGYKSKIGRSQRVGQRMIAATRSNRDERRIADLLQMVHLDNLAGILGG